jgi:hypothetical protein
MDKMCSFIIVSRLGRFLYMQEISKEKLKGALA